MKMFLFPVDITHSNVTSESHTLTVADGCGWIGADGKIVVVVYLV